MVPSTVKVAGRRLPTHPGGAAAGWSPRGLIVTNAHVVAGESSTVLQRSDGTEVEATVVAFDPDRDLAVLQRPDLDRAPLPRGRRRSRVTSGGVRAPRGGPLRAGAVRGGSPGGRHRHRTSTTRPRTERDVLVLASALRPGDSGAR